MQEGKPGVRPRVRRPDPVPDALVVDGRFRLGMFTAPLRRANTLDARLREGLDLPRAAKWLLLKEWQHFALVSPSVYVSLAIFDSKRISLAQIIVYERASGRLITYERKLSSAAIEQSSDLWDGHARVDRGGVAISVHNHLDAGVHRLELRGAATRARPPLFGRFTAIAEPRAHEPLVVCLPLSRHRALYSHKALVPLEGELMLGSTAHTFSRADSFCLVDIHQGYYPYVMKWRWATGARVDPDGGLVGFNLTANQVRDPERYNENALWIDGKVQLLPPVRFELDPDAPDRPWRVRDDEGRVDLVFWPEKVRTVDLDLLVLASRYRGPVGGFGGTIVADDGRPVVVDGAYGMAEDFYLRG